MSTFVKLIMLLAAVLGIVTLGGAGIFWATRTSAEPAAPSPAPTNEAQAVVELQPTAPPPTAPVQVVQVQPTAQPTVPAPTATVQSPTPAVPALFLPLFDELRGTVRPPGCKGVTVISNGPYSGGEYSICGMAVAKVTLKREGLEVELRLQNHTTKGAGVVLVGTIELTVRLDKKKVDGPHDPYADIQMCYAVPPGKEVEVKFYDTAQNTWVALETTVEGGQACAPANYSGDYVLVEK